MAQFTFGSYLRDLRKAKNPPMTQEMIAKKIGRQKMTISQFEQGKNAPPQGDLLDKIILALALSSEEEQKLRYLAAVSRNAVPSDISDYFFSNPAICDVIRTAKQNGYSNTDWEKIEISLSQAGKRYIKRTNDV